MRRPHHRRAMRLAAVARTARLGPLAAPALRAGGAHRGPPAAFAASAVKREQQPGGASAPGQQPRGQGGGPANSGGKGKGGGGKRPGERAPEKESTVEERRWISMRMGGVRMEWRGRE